MQSCIIFAKIRQVCVKGTRIIVKLPGWQYVRNESVFVCSQLGQNANSVLIHWELFYSKEMMHIWRRNGYVVAPAFDLKTSSQHTTNAIELLQPTHFKQSHKNNSLIDPL